jgi:hypothetical protein
MLPRTRLVLAGTILSIAWSVPALCQSEAEYQAACQNDALNYCIEHLPDRAKIKSCLLAHKRSLTPACRALMSPAHGTKSKKG